MRAVRLHRTSVVRALRGTYSTIAWRTQQPPARRSDCRDQHASRGCALLALWVVGFDLSVIGIVGIILLIGVVKKNGIMLVDFAIRREREGEGAEAAIREACLLRFGPILMTTMAGSSAGSR